MFGNIDGMNHAGRLLHMIGNRQKIIGENMANVDTPGYTRKDVSFSDCLSPSLNNLESKINKKFGGSVMSVENTGQTVNMGTEIVEMQKNAIMYSMAVRRMTSAITEMKTVLNVGK